MDPNNILSALAPRNSKEATNEGKQGSFTTSVTPTMNQLPPQVVAASISKKRKTNSVSALHRSSYVTSSSSSSSSSYSSIPTSPVSTHRLLSSHFLRPHTTSSVGGRREGNLLDAMQAQRRLQEDEPLDLSFQQVQQPKRRKREQNNNDDDDEDPEKPVPPVFDPIVSPQEMEDRYMAYYGNVKKYSNKQRGRCVRRSVYFAAYAQCVSLDRKFASYTAETSDDTKRKHINRRYKNWLRDQRGEDARRQGRPPVMSEEDVEQVREQVRRSREDGEPMGRNKVNQIIAARIRESKAASEGTEGNNSDNSGDSAGATSKTILKYAALVYDGLPSVYA